MTKAELQDAIRYNRDAENWTNLTWETRVLFLRLEKQIHSSGIWHLRHKNQLHEILQAMLEEAE